MDNLPDCMYNYRWDKHDYQEEDDDTDNMFAPDILDYDDQDVIYLDKDVVLSKNDFMSRVINDMYNRRYEERQKQKEFSDYEANR